MKSTKKMVIEEAIEAPILDIFVCIPIDVLVE